MPETSGTDQPDDPFEQIVEGLEFDLSDLGDLDEAAQDAADTTAEAVPPATDEPPPEFEEVTYRIAPAVRHSTDTWRRRGWFFVLLAPLALFVAKLANIWVSKNFGVLAAVVWAGVLAWLLLTTNEGRGVPPGTDDGTTL